MQRKDKQTHTSASLCQWAAIGDPCKFVDEIPEYSDCRAYNIENGYFHREFEGDVLKMEL